MNTNNTQLRLGCLIVAAVLGGCGCSTEQQAEVPSTETVRNVSVLEIKEDNIPDVRESVGTVRAAQTSDLASQMMGNIVKSGFMKETGSIEVKCSLSSTTPSREPR
jgi:ABC-type molybdenum transport system ATPase subunit/photorepair protein PhrA